MGFGLLPSWWSVLTASEATPKGDLFGVVWTKVSHNKNVNFAGGNLCAVSTVGTV